MVHRVPIPPPVKCSAVTASTGQPCKRWAKPGAIVCAFHGANAGQVKAKANVRRLLATLLASDARPVWEVLLDAVHAADAIAREARHQVDAADEITAEHVERLTEAIRLSHTMSSAAITTKAYEMAATRDGKADEYSSRIIDVLDQITAELVKAYGVPTDRQALDQWIRTSVPSAMASVPIEPAPPVWRLAHAPMLESGDDFRERQAEDVAEALRGALSAADPDPGTRVQDGAVRRRRTDARASGGRYSRNPKPVTTPTLAELQRGGSAGARNPMSQKIV